MEQGFFHVLPHTGHACRITVDKRGQHYYIRENGFVKSPLRSVATTFTSAARFHRDFSHPLRLLHPAIRSIEFRRYAWTFSEST
jgi:hypothetical protein